MDYEQPNPTAQADDPPIATIKKRSPQSIPWTPEMIDWLKRLWEPNKKSASVIAAEMGCTRNAILGKVNRLRLPSHKQNNSQRPQKTWRPRQQPAPPKPAKPEAPAINFIGIEFMELSATTCRFPEGDEHPYLFCGSPIREGSPYCAGHHAIVYTPARPRLPSSFFKYKGPMR